MSLVSVVSLRSEDGLEGAKSNEVTSFWRWSRGCDFICVTKWPKPREALAKGHSAACRLRLWYSVPE